MKRVRDLYVVPITSTVTMLYSVYETSRYVELYSAMHIKFVQTLHKHGEKPTTTTFFDLLGPLPKWITLHWSILYYC